MNPRIESLEKMLDGPRDNALLRFSLGNEYLKAGAMTDYFMFFAMKSQWTRLQKFSRYFGRRFW